MCACEKKNGKVVFVEIGMFARVWWKYVNVVFSMVIHRNLRKW